MQVDLAGCCMKGSTEQQTLCIKEITPAYELIQVPTDLQFIHELIVIDHW